MVGDEIRPGWVVLGSALVKEDRRLDGGGVGTSDTIAMAFSRRGGRAAAGDIRGSMATTRQGSAVRWL